MKFSYLLRFSFSLRFLFSLKSSSSLKFSSFAFDLNYESIIVTKQISFLHLLFVAHYESRFRNRYMFSSMQCQLILKFIRQRNWSIEFFFRNTIDNAALTIEYMNEITREIQTCWMTESFTVFRRKMKNWIVNQIIENKNYWLLSFHLNWNNTLENTIRFIFLFSLLIR